MKRIILSTENINRYGFRVLTSGIRLDAFKKNPVMYFGHNTWSMPIGTWTDLKVEGGNLTAVPQFDEGDPLAMEVKRKYEAGILNAASIGFNAISTSDDPKMLLSGQRYATVTECELLEVSIVGIPANSEATGLNYASEVLLTHHLNLIKPLVNMEKIALSLGLAATASEADILAAIEKLQTAEVESVLSLGKAKGVVTDDNIAGFREAAKTGTAGLRLAFSAVPDKAIETPKEVAPSSATLPASGTLAAASLGATANVAPTDKATWSYLDWEQKDPKGLLAMQRQDPKAYEALVLAYQP